MAALDMQDVNVEVQRLQDGSKAVREQAAKTLGRMGEKTAAFAVGPLVHILASEDTVTVRIQAARALGKIACAPMAADRVSATKALLRCFEDSDARVRAAAVRAIGRVVAAEWSSQLHFDYATEHRAHMAVARCLEDDDAKVREAAAGACGHLGELATCAAAEALAVCLSDDIVGVRVAAAGALACHLPSAAELLVGRLSDADVEVRSRAARALGRMGPAAAPHSSECLMKCIGDADLSFRTEVQTALALMKRVRIEDGREFHEQDSHAEDARDTTPEKVVRYARDVQMQPGKSRGGRDQIALPLTACRHQNNDEIRLPKLLGTPTAKVNKAAVEKRGKIVACEVGQCDSSLVGGWKPATRGVSSTGQDSTD